MSFQSHNGLIYTIFPAIDIDFIDLISIPEWSDLYDHLDMEIRRFKQISIPEWSDLY